MAVLQAYVIKHLLFVDVDPALQYNLEERLEQYSYLRQTQTSVILTKNNTGRIFLKTVFAKVNTCEICLKFLIGEKRNKRETKILFCFSLTIWLL